MSKLNKLIKQSELFERLAVFGDRSTFLKSLAQGLVLNSVIRDAINNVTATLSTGGPGGSMVPNAQPLFNQLSDMLNSPSVDPQELLTTLTASMNYMNNITAIKNLTELIEKVKETIYVNDTPYTSTPKQLKYKVDSRVAKVQETFNKLVQSEPNIGKPIQVDGQYGDETAAAITSFMTHMKMQPSDRSKAIEILTSPTVLGMSADQVKVEIEKLLEPYKTSGVPVINKTV